MSLGDIKSLSEAVTSEAKQERERTLTQAESLARNTRDQARADAEVERKRIMREAASEAQRLLEQTRATTRLEAQSLKLERRELLLSNVFDLAAARLSNVQSLEDYRSAAFTLVRDAVEHMDKVGALVMRADDVTRAFFDESTLDEVSSEVGCELSLGSVLEEDTGLIVQSLDGHLAYDNTLQARLDRHRSSLRASVFQILRGGDA
jgi:vacuolar-type H+-ATPase subunit E/Vma4